MPQGWLGQDKLPEGHCMFQNLCYLLPGHLNKTVINVQKTDWYNTNAGLSEKYSASIWKTL